MWGTKEERILHTYLRIVNPIAAALVVLFCPYAATVEDGECTVAGRIKGGIPTYGFAKGPFCSSAFPS